MEFFVQIGMSKKPLAAMLFIVDKHFKTTLFWLIGEKPAEEQSPSEGDKPAEGSPTDAAPSETAPSESPQTEAPAEAPPTETPAS